MFNILGRINDGNKDILNGIQIGEQKKLLKNKAYMQVSHGCKSLIIQAVDENIHESVFTFSLLIEKSNNIH
ncbi:MAG: hypothetical protein A4E59_01400 [Syntrophorhabdus sp. PtaB.Bin027]|nr:MAG: hypothetical protein A4E59_01400 [Syntrophorhabdus sp. PtaB.Bin027]